MRWAYDQARAWLVKKHPYWYIDGQRVDTTGRTVFSARKNAANKLQASAKTASLAARRLDTLLAAKVELPSGSHWNDYGLFLGDVRLPARSLAAGKLELAAFVLAGSL